MLNIPPHLEACRPRGLFSIFHGTSSPVARRCPRASDLVLSAEHAFLLYERPGLHLQSGASAVGGVLHGATAGMGRTGRPDAHFNPRTPCGVRRRVYSSISQRKNISIHAPRAGCDVGSGNIWLATNTISIHAPRAGCDASQIWGLSPRLRRFQSTHPVRGATCMLYNSHGRAQFQSTHPVRGATSGSLRSSRSL